MKLQKKYCETHRFKVSYSTKKAALTAVNKSRACDGVELNIYKCPSCRNFHLTSQKKRPS